MTQRITTQDEARAFWAAYRAKYDALLDSDREAQAAFGVNPNRALAFDRDFWKNTYTPEVHAALKSFGEEYDS